MIEKKTSMNEAIKKDLHKAIFTIVVTAVIAITGSFIQVYVTQHSMNQQMQRMEREQEMIKAKIQIIEIEMETKIDAKTLDEKLYRIEDKIDALIKK